MVDLTPPEAWGAIETREPLILEQVYRLRVDAWRSRSPDFPAMGIWTDEFDADGRHWVVLDAGIPVAAARLTVHPKLAETPSGEIYRGLLPDDLPGPIGVLTRLVVARSHAGLGLTRLLDIARIDAARDQGCRHLIGETFAGLPRLAQLGRLGFEVIGQASPYSSGPLALVKATDGGGGTGVPAIIRLAFDHRDMSADQPSCRHACQVISTVGTNPLSNSRPPVAGAVQQGVCGC